MPSSYSTNLKVELIATGEQSGTWGATTNANLGTALEQAIVGRATANFTADADLTLTLTDTNATQVARAFVLNVTSGVSLTTTRNLVVPTINKPYLVQNNTTGSQSIIVKTAAGTGVTVPNGREAFVYADGTNVVQAIDTFDSLVLTGTPTAPTAAAGTNTTQIATTAHVFAERTNTATLTNKTLTSPTISGGTINNAVIGGTTPAAGTFTTLDANGNVTLGDAAGDTITINGAATFANVNPTLTAGTANGVTYLNGSKVLTSGSALTFDGTGFGVLTSAPTVTIRETASGNSNRLIISQAAGITTYNQTYSSASTNAQVWQIGNAEQMRLTSTGLGIGTSSPRTKLDVSAGEVFISNGTAGAASTGGTLWLNTGTQSTLRTAGIQAISSSAGNDHSLLFYTNASAASPVERLRIDSSGNVGVGTSSPGAKLDVAATSGTIGNFQANFGGAGGLSAVTIKTNTSVSSGLTLRGNGSGATVYGGALAASVFNAENAPLLFGTNNTERLRIDSSGNVGIGSSSPSVKLEVNVGSSAAWFTRVAGDYGTTNAAIGYLTTATTGQIRSYGDMLFYTAAIGGSQVERLRIDASGNVGIGTSAPGQALEVNGLIWSKRTTDSAQFSARNDGGVITIAKDSSTGSSFSEAYSANIYCTGAYPLRLWTNGSERLRIDSSGNVGIGTSSPGYKLHIGGLADGAVGLRVTAGSTNTDISSAGISCSRPLVYFSATAGAMIIRGTDHRFEAADGSTERMRITSTGNVGIGTSSPQRALHVNGSVGAMRLQGTSVGGYIEIVGPSNTSFIGTPAAIASGSTTDLAFYISSAERLRIDSAGNVGIGVSSSVAAETVGLSISANQNIYAKETSGESYLNIFRQSGSGGSVFANGYKYTATTNGFASATSVSWAKSAMLLGDGAVKFYTNTVATVAAGTDVTPTERLRIDSAGNVLVGTTTNTNSTLMVVNGEISETTNGVQYKLVNQSDIGTGPNEIPLNQYLGPLAFRDQLLVSVPASATAAGNVGDVAADSSYIYVCIAPNSWVRASAAAW